MAQLLSAPRLLLTCAQLLQAPAALTSRSRWESGQRLKWELETRKHDGTLHVDLPLAPCLASFLIQSRLSYPGNDVAHSGQTPPALTNRQDNPHRQPADQYDVGNSSIEALFPGDSRLCPVNSGR